jgi:hypothetical protein
MADQLTLTVVQRVLDELYQEGKVSKSMRDGEEVYFLVDPPVKQNATPPVPAKEKIESGDSYNLLQRFDPPIPYPYMKWRSEVYEITGLDKDGNRIISKFFALDQKDKAVEYLRTMQKGHLWLSEATDYLDPDCGMFTGRRKRVHLLSPDAISK